MKIDVFNQIFNQNFLGMNTVTYKIKISIGKKRSRRKYIKLTFLSGSNVSKIFKFQDSYISPIRTYGGGAEEMD